MIERALMPLLRQQLDAFPCVLLLGARQVGKSTLATSLAEERGDAAIMINLTEPNAAPIRRDPQAFLLGQTGRLVILDKVHTVPTILEELRGQVALRWREGFKNGQFLLLGSDTQALREWASERLMGNATILELPTLQPLEVPGANSGLVNDEEIVAEVTEISTADPRELETRLWVRGGMPRSYLAQDEQASYAWRRAYVDAAVARRFMINGEAIPFETCERAWLTLAQNHGNEVPWQELGECLGCMKPSVRRFIDAACDHRMLRLLDRWYENDKKRRLSRKKVYFRDSGLLHAYLRLSDFSAVDRHYIKGKSWEGHALEAVVNVSAPDVSPCYFKTDDERGEIDIVLARDNRTWAIEVKLADRPKLTSAFYRAVEELKPERTIAIYRGSERYKPNSQIELMSLSDAIREVATF